MVSAPFTINFASANFDAVDAFWRDLTGAVGTSVRTRHPSNNVTWDAKVP